MTVKRIISGENHYRFNGYYVTPAGKFDNPTKAGAANSIDSSKVYYKCKQGKQGWSFELADRVILAKIKRPLVYLPVPQYIDEETFKIISGTNGRYEVSNHSRVRRAVGLTKGAILKQFLSDNKYLRVNLGSVSKRPITAVVHRLVATLFIPNPDSKPEVNHKNLNKQDNHHSNLEWVTGEENRDHYGKRKIGSDVCYTKVHPCFINAKFLLKNAPRCLPAPPINLSSNDSTFSLFKTNLNRNAGACNAIQYSGVSRYINADPIT